METVCNYLQSKPIQTWVETMCPPSFPFLSTLIAYSWQCAPQRLLAELLLAFMKVKWIRHIGNYSGLPICRSPTSLWFFYAGWKHYSVWEVPCFAVSLVTVQTLFVIVSNLCRHYCYVAYLKEIKIFIFLNWEIASSAYPCKSHPKSQCNRVGGGCQGLLSGY